MSRLLLDLQGAQSVDHRDRGVARYVLEHARAVERLTPGRVAAFLLNPRLPPPGDMEALLATGRVRGTDEVRAGPADVVHLLSPIELSLPLDDAYPPALRPGRLVVTLYDLIPDVLADRYLVDPGQRRRWRTRVELARVADHVLAISQATAVDAVDRLGLDRTRVTVIGTGTSPQFRPPADRAAAREEARHRVAGLGPRWVLYTGGTDERKNVERLLEAWGLLPERLRRDWQLVIACHVPPLTRNHYLVTAARLGFGAGLLVPGYVPEDVLVLLNQGADLAVFPSLYEGYGLPVAEALACGTPAVASRTSSLPELVPEAGLFDPYDPASMAATLTRALSDDGFRASLAAESGAGRPPQTWDDVAERTVAAYDRLDAAPRFCRPNRGARRPDLADRTGVVGTRAGREAGLRVAFVSPLPPQPTGVADFSFRLLAALAALGEAGEVGEVDGGLTVDAYVDGPPHLRDAMLGAEAPAGIEVRPLAALERVEALAGPYDEVVCSLGNSEYHTGALALLLRRRRARRPQRPAVAVAHDVMLLNLWRFAQWQHPAAVPGGFRETLHAMYGGALPPDLGEPDRIDPADAARWGIAMARGAITASRRYLVTSEFAASWARTDARPADRSKVAALPFPLGTMTLDASATGALEPGRGGRGRGGRGRGRQPVVASFGVVDDAKEPAALVTMLGALPDRSTRLVFVGPIGAEQRARIDAAARRAGVSARVEATGAVDPAAYRDWLQRAWVAVQLRSRTQGESSAAVGDCLAAGLPTVLTSIGAARALPADAVAFVPPGVSAAELAAVVGGLLADPDRRDGLAAAARAYAAARTFRHAATALLAELRATPTQPPAGAPA